jgi:solute carrier family 35 (adenosine 3'-phospho 5'-phosphosulfate transporter), member B2
MAALMPPGRGAAAADAWSVAIATAALLIYGVLQERVMTRAWGEGDSAELFPHSAFLVLCNRLLTVIALAAAALVRGSSLAPVAPLRAYCLVSASNMLSTLCQYEALKYVSFVTQTLAKTGKALPVLLWGRLVGGRRYRREQYAHALAITAGCAVFVLGGDITSAAAGAGAGAGAAAAPAASVVGGLITYGAGLGLLGVYLAADGWTSTAQEALYRLHGTPIREQLLYTTTFSAAYSLAAALAAGQMRPALGFLARHPDAAAAVLGLSAMSTVIQVCALAAICMCTYECVFVYVQVYKWMCT